MENNTNGIGTAGFILAIIGLFFGWLPFLGFLIVLTGAILSLVGVFKAPRGMSIAGIIISAISLLIYTLITALFITAAAAA